MDGADACEQSAHAGALTHARTIRSPRRRSHNRDLELSLMLTLSPLIAAICGGNVAVIKPSEVAPATADVIARLVPEYLDRSAFSVVLGAVPETTALLEQQWDHIFFTGGTPVAKIVLTAAAKN